MIDAYRARLVAEGKLSARSVNKLLVQLHAIFKRVQRLHRLPNNPAAGIDRQPLKRSGDIDVLTPAEVEALVRAAETEQDAAIFSVAAFTGLRLGELRALRWADVDFASRKVHVRRNFTSGTLGHPKSGKVRSVPLIDQAVPAFDRLSRREHFTAPDDLVFCSPTGAHIDDSALRRRYSGALDRAGLRRLRFHDLRHTCPSRSGALEPLPRSSARIVSTFAGPRGRTSSRRGARGLRTSRTGFEVIRCPSTAR